MLAKIPAPVIENALCYGETLNYLLRDAHVKNAFKQNVDHILIRLDMTNSIKQSETNPGPSGNFYTLAIGQRQLIVTVNFDNYDFNRAWPNFDMKFYGLFKPSPLVLGLIEAAEKKIEPLNKKLDAAAGKPLPIKFDWSFLEHPNAAKEDPKRMIPSLVDNFVTFTTTNGGTLVYMTEKRPEIKAALNEKIDSLIYRIDPTDSINDPSGIGGSSATHYVPSLAGRALLISMNLNKWDAHSFGALEPKLNALFFPPPEAPAPVVAAAIVLAPVEIKVAAEAPIEPAKAVTPGGPIQVTTSLAPTVAVPPPAAVATPAAAAPAAAAAPPVPAGFPAGARADLVKAGEGATKTLEDYRKKLAERMKKPSFGLSMDWDFLVDPAFVSRSDATTVINGMKEGVFQYSTVYSESVSFLVDRFEPFRECFQKKVDKLVFQPDLTNSVKETAFPNCTWFAYTYDSGERTLYFRFNIEEYKSNKIYNIRERLELLFDLYPAIIRDDLKKPVTDWTAKLGGALKIEIDFSFTSDPEFRKIPRNDILKFGTEWFPEMFRTTIHCDGLSRALETPASKEAILARVDKLIYRFDPTNSINSTRGQEKHWEPSFDDDNRALVFTYNLSGYNNRLGGNLMQKLDPLIDLTSLKLAARAQETIKKYADELNTHLGSQLVITAAFAKLSAQPNFKDKPEHEKSTLFTQISDQVQSLIGALKLFSTDLAEYKEWFLTFVKTIEIEYTFSMEFLESEPHECGAMGTQFTTQPWFAASIDTDAKRVAYSVSAASLPRLDKPFSAAHKIVPHLQIAAWRAQNWVKMAEGAQASILSAIGTTVPFTLDNSIFYAAENRYPKISAAGGSVFKARHDHRASFYNRTQVHLDAVVLCFKEIAHYDIGKTTLANSISSVHVILQSGGRIQLDINEEKTLVVAIPHINDGAKGSRRSWFAEIEYLLRIHIQLWKLRAADNLAHYSTQIAPALGGKNVVVELNWAFVESDYFRSLKDGVKIGDYLGTFAQGVVAGVIQSGIVKTAQNVIGKACIESKVNKVVVSIESTQAKPAISSFDAGSGVLSISLSAPGTHYGFSELVQSALDLIIEIALNDCKEVKQQVTEFVSTISQHSVAINIDINTFNRDATFLEFRPETQSQVVHYLSSALLKTVKEAFDFLKQYPVAVDALKANLKEINVSVANATTAAGSQKTISNSIAQLIYDAGILKITVPLAKLAAAASIENGNATTDWAIPLASLLAVDVQVGILQATHAVKHLNDRLSKSAKSPVALVVDWESIHTHPSLSAATPTHKFNVLQGAAAALTAVFYSDGGLNSIEYLLEFAPINKFFADNVKSIIAKFVSAKLSVEKTATGFGVNVPHDDLLSPGKVGAREQIETLFNLRPIVEQTVKAEFDQEHQRLVSEVASTAGKAVPVEFEGWAQVLAAKTADYVNCLRLCGKVQSGALGKGGLVGLCARNATARHSLAKVTKVVLRVDPNNKVRAHIGQFVHSDYDAVLSGSTLEISGSIGARGQLCPDPNIEWVLAPEIARADERAELDRLERERIRMEQERREREERERREQEEREKREREERERREKEEAKRREEDRRRYEKEYANWKERSEKKCVQCYGKAELKCPKCNGNGGNCSRCDGNRTIRCGTCAGTGRLDPYLWQNPPHPPN